MGKYCAMRTCKYVDVIKPGIRRHRFPSSLDLRKKWERFVVEGNRNTKFRSQPSNYFTLCERHFEPSCYNSNGRLRKNAVPTIADKFTAEVALKFSLIPSLDSNELEKVNKFPGNVIRKVRTPEPAEKTDISTTSSVIEVLGGNSSGNGFGNGTLELMVIDLGEACGEGVTSSDNALLSPRFSKAVGHDENAATEDSPSGPSSRLRSFNRKKQQQTNQNNTEIIRLLSTSPRKSEEPQTLPCGCHPRHHETMAWKPEQAVKEFTVQSEQLSQIKRDLKNTRRRYKRAMMKIETLTGVLDQLRKKRGLKSVEPYSLDSCESCGKLLQ